MNQEFVLVFIIGHGDDCIDQAMVVMKKGYNIEARDEMLRDISDASDIENPEVIGQVDITHDIAHAMSEFRVYIG